jgi:DNA-directed RNA polymerase subunit RPC12/RpoP
MEEWDNRRFKQGACLHCGKELDGISGPKGHDPQKGSIMVCGYCSYVMEWGGEGFAELSEAAMKELETEPDLKQALARTRAFRAALKGEVKVLVLEELPPEICQDCGKLKELRPYGKKQANGVRQWVCKACAEKDPAEMERAFEERMEGKNPV